MRLSSFLLFVLAAAASRAQQIDLIQNPSARQGISLNGRWQALMDPYEAGYYDFHLNPIKDGGLGANRVPANPGDKFELAFRPNTPTLAVPGDWNTQQPELLWYEGSVWYRREFDYAAPATPRRQFLWFGAANYQAIVFLNGKKLGQHEGGFTPFQFEVTGLLKPHGNALIVKVDNQRHPDAVPPAMTDWWNYGGLTRDVKLIDVPDTFIEDYQVQLEKRTLNVAGWVRLSGTRKRQKVSIRIPEAGASATIETGDDGYARFSFRAKLALWSPERPKLYQVSVDAETDRVAERIGFRLITVAGTKILLNDSPVFLRGVAIHAEAPFRAGRVFSEADARTLLGWAKEMGCNFVRLAHYPHDEVMTRLADEMGLLVWSEIPVYWAVQWENPAVYAKAEHMLAEMITRDRNRASVVFWSMANETPLGDARTKFLSSLAAKARELDNARLITAATLPHTGAPNTIVLDDPLGKVLDVLGCNEYIGWYDGGPEKADRTSFQNTYDKPLVMSEFGAEAPYGNHGDDTTAWTEEYQANVYRHQLPMLQRIPFLQGMAAWVLMDFRCPRRFLSGIQDYYNRKGLFSDRGEKKQAYFVLRDFYRSTADASR